MSETAIIANLDAERAVLGGVLLRNDCYSEAAATLKPQDFALDSHRRLFARMIELGEAGKGIDCVTLANQLLGTNEIEAVGGVAYISSLTEGLPDRDHLGFHVEIVRDRARRRQMVNICEAGALAAADVGEPSTAQLDRLQESLLDLAADSTRAEAQHVAKFTDEVFGNLEHLRKLEGEVVGLTTGIGSLDKQTSGIRPGELWLLGGWPGDGKSSIALQCTLANISASRPVCLFTIEMSRDQALTRLWAQHSGIPWWKMRDPRNLSEFEYHALRRAMVAIAEMPLYVDDSGSLSVRELTARSRLATKRHKAELIVVDYVQLLDADGKDERSRLTRISKSLRQLAKEGVPVLALSQLSRPKDGSQSTRPNKFALKESGSLEADAHTVLLTYRPKKEGQFTGEDEIIIDKQRNGPCGIEPVVFDGKALVYRERVR